MKLNTWNGYKSFAQKELEDSPVYHFKTWQTSDSNREDVLQEFMDFIVKEIEGETEKEEKKIKEALKIFKQAMDLYLNQDMKKIAQGEQELLSRWIESTTGE